MAPLLAALSGGRIAGRAPQRPAPAPPEPTGPAPSDVLDVLRAFAPSTYVEEVGEPTRALLDRLEDGDVDAILAAAEPEWRRHYDAAGPSVQAELVLNYAVHWDVQPALSRIGLPREQPPGDVHTMARGPLAAAGALWFADRVVEAAARAGSPLRPGARVLDFGCSSGRVLRVLAAWREDVEWLGCDPNVAAVRWADENLEGVRAFASPQEPPLPGIDDESLDLVFAISVWSHFGATQAVRWLDEMHRVVKPGGALVLTTQGFAALAHYLRGGHVPEEYARQGAAALLAQGHHYVESFGDEGDWGVKHPEWGMAYLTVDWLAARVLPRWSLAIFEPARVSGNQDVVCLVRR